jgi:hypothetical protein
MQKVRGGVAANIPLRRIEALLALFTKPEVGVAALENAAPMGLDLLSPVVQPDLTRTDLRGELAPGKRLS